MRGVLSIVIIGLLFAGCSSSKQIARLQKKGYLLPSTDTIYVSGEPKDTTITVYMEGDTVVKEVLLFMDGEMPTIDPVEAETEFAHASAREEGGKIILTLTQKDAFFDHHLEDAIQVDTIYIKDVLEVIKEVEPKNYSFFKSGFWILLGLTLFMILLLILIKRR